jgi:serine/threonine protein kinase
MTRPNDDPSRTAEDQAFETQQAPTRLAPGADEQPSEALPTRAPDALGSDSETPYAHPGKAPPSRRPERAFGDYELLEEVARGGMGVVYKARQRSLGRTVALKMILEGQLASETAVQRFRQEARAAAGLDHPHIVPIYEVGQHDDHHYFTMALVDGTSLSSVVRRGGLPAPAEAAAIVLAVAEAVAYAHAQGIIHRDLKPDNVLLDRQGRPRITDFGLAKSVEGNVGLTASGQILGTPSYMAPEQALGSSRKIGPAADVYALGGILYFVLTGKAPFTGSSVMEVLYRVMDQAPTPPRQINPEVPPELEAICLKCLEKDPARRYAGAAEMAAALRPYAAQGSMSITPIPRLLDPPSSATGTECPTGTTPFTAVKGPSEMPSLSAVSAGTPPPAASLPAAVKPHRRRWLLAGSIVAGLALLAGGAFLAAGRWGSPPGGQASGPDKQPGPGPDLAAGRVGPPGEPVSGPEKQPAGPAEPVLVPKPKHHDFGLKVEIVGSAPGQSGERLLAEGQKLEFRIEVERDAYVGVWNVGPDGSIMQIFPNEFESDHLVRARQPRTVPGGAAAEEYELHAAFSGGTEWVWAVASTDRWKPPEGERAGPYLIFRTKEQKRAILLVPTAKKAKVAVAEQVLPYRVHR